MFHGALHQLQAEVPNYSLAAAATSNIASDDLAKKKKDASDEAVENC